MFLNFFFLEIKAIKYSAEYFLVEKALRESKMNDPSLKEQDIGLTTLALLKDVVVFPT
jgi:hypothetical protein